MKNFSERQKAVLLCLVLLIVGVAFVDAQGLQQAAQKVEGEVNGIRGTIKNTCGGLAFIAGIIGLIQKNYKTHVENEQASKAYIGWYVGAGIFAITWGVMQLFYV